jgi:hypothetical protein
MWHRKVLINPKTLVALPIVLVVVIIFFISTPSDLRGSWRPSMNGNTYLIIDNDDGWPREKPIIVDGVIWRYPVGQSGRVEPGLHSIGCYGGEISFQIRRGMVYRFKYWGP